MIKISLKKKILSWLSKAGFFVKQFGDVTLGKLMIILTLVILAGAVVLTAAVWLNYGRMSARDEIRALDMLTLRRALTAYFKSSPVGYPPSSGECLSAVSGVGAELKDSQVLSALPADPLWPETGPAAVAGGSAVSPAAGFCYYYYSAAAGSYQLSYCLETDSPAGRAGSHRLIQPGEAGP